MRDRTKKSDRTGHHAAGRFKHLYDEALKPVSADRGSAYAISQYAIDQVTGTRLSNRRRPTVDEREAALEISSHNDIGREIPGDSAENDAIGRLDRVFTKLDSPHQLGPDLIIKAFKDLDNVFFAGRLLGYVDVRWSPNVTHMAVYGHVEHGQNGTAHIIMDARKCFTQCREASPWPEIFATLLHEMTHTLSYVRAHEGQPECDAQCSHNRGMCGHGQWFRLMLHNVHRRAKKLNWLNTVIKDDYAPDYRQGHLLSQEWKES